MKHVLILALAVTLALSGCGSNEEDEMDLEQRMEQRAAVTRGHIDDLVERLDGSSIEVVGNDVVDCDPQDRDAGLMLNYTVRFTVDDDAVARLQGEIAEALEAEGWTVRRDARNDEQGVVSVRFLKDTFSMGSKISETGNATAGGSSGCVS